MKCNGFNENPRILWAPGSRGVFVWAEFLDACLSLQLQENSRRAPWEPSPPGRAPRGAFLYKNV